MRAAPSARIPANGWMRACLAAPRRLFAQALSGTTGRAPLLIALSMKIASFSVHGCAAALAILAAFPVHSQPSAATSTLQPVVVTGSLVEQRVIDALPATTLITRADIERSQLPDLVSLLKSVAGVEVAQNGGAGTLASAFIRGAEARHTLVIVDGVAVNNLNFSLAALEHLPLSNIERIEVVHGNLSSLYGSSALGGVIRVFTREAGNQSYAHVTAQAGSRGLALLQLGGGVKVGVGTRLSFTAETLQDKGFNAIDQVKRTGTNPDDDGYKRRSFSVGISQDFGVGKVSLSANEARGTTSYDSQFGPAAQADESDFVIQGATLTGRFSLAPSVAMDIGLSSRVDKLSAQVTAFPYFVNSFSDSATAGLRWQFAKGQNVTAGLESVRQRLESDTVYNASARQLESLRLGYLGELDRHQIQVNARQDRYSDFGTASTWFAGYGFRITEAWRVNASASTGFNAPTFNDLYYPFGGNANLRAEQVRSSEIGLQYATDTTQARAIWFSNKFTDLIGNDANFDRININQARNEGVEFSYQGQFGATGLRAGLTVQDPMDLTTQKRLDRRAAVLANLGLTHDLGAWALGANLRYSAARPDGSKSLSSYAVIDLNVSCAISPELKVFGRIDNLLDARYETVYGYNQPGVGVFAGISWQPKLPGQTTGK